MKNFVLLLKLMVLYLLCSCSSGSCNKESTFYVRGNCEMCQERIEKALQKTEGVCKATWDVESKKATVLYDDTKVKPDQLYAVCAGVGHDTQSIPATDDVHAQLPECCQRKSKEM